MPQQPHCVPFNLYSLIKWSPLHKIKFTYNKIGLQRIRVKQTKRLKILFNVNKLQHTHTHARTHARTHAHTHTHPFNGPFSGTTQVSWYQKGKTMVWILLKQETVSGSGISWAICKFAPCSREITMPAPHRSVVYRPDALPAAKPTAPKHRRQKAV